MEKIEKIKPTGIFTNYIYKSIPLAFDESMSYYETLCGLLDKVKTIEEVVNNHADIIYELEQYVKNYFDNLDVQEEINNKLDEMTESGELEDIISQYIELMTTYVYNNVNEMKEATNLINGSFARTSGFYAYNDGGGAYYKIRTITNEDTIDNILLFALTNDNTLVAELIVTDEMNVKQFGAIDNNTFDNTTIFNKIASLDISKIKYEGNIFKTNGTINFLDKENFELDFNCKIHIASSVNSGTACIRLLRCKNVKVNGYYVYSERDKNEQPQGDQTRVSPYGSNIYGLVIRSCENVFINNVYFENMSNDFVISIYDLDNLETYPKSKNVYITNYKSLNASQNNLLSNCENIYYNYIDLKPAIDMGSGDHCFYITDKCENININNSKIELQDENFGVLFQSYYVSDQSKKIYIENANIKANRLCYAYANTDLHFKNIVFEDIGITERNNFILMGGTSYVEILDSEIINLNRPITRSDTSGTNLFINNTKIKEKTGNTNNLIQITGTNNFNIVLNNLYIENLQSHIFYSGTDATGEIKILNCYIEKISDYLYSKRNTAPKLLISNTQVINSTGTDISHLGYNGSADSTNITYLNSYFKGFETAGYNLTNLVSKNSYLNNTLIS